MSDATFPSLRFPNGEKVPWNSVHELVEARARQHGEALRVEVAGRPSSWAEIDRLSSALAAQLQRKGIRQGDTVATMMNNRIEQLVVWFAASKLGALWVPFNIGLIGDDLSYTLTDAAPKALFIEDAVAEKFDPPGDRISLPSIFINVDVETLPDTEAPPAKADVSLTDPAVIIYTGGTTGRPKGVVLSQFAFIAAGYRYRDAYDVRSTDRHFSVLSLCHVGGTQNGIMGPLVADIPVAMERRFSGSAFWNRVKETKATIIDPVSTMLTVLCQTPPSERDRDHDARIMARTTAQLPPDIVTAFRSRFGVEMVNLYSLSEAGGSMIISNPPNSAKPEANGIPGEWAEYRVVDQLDQPVPADQIGEIVLRPKVPFSFMMRYHNDPERTAETWSNLWLHTGDLGRIDEDGFLYFMGRQAHWLRSRGENVSCYEVEAAIGLCPGVAEVGVVGVPAELGEEEVKAFIVPARETRVAPEEIIEWCRARLAPFKVPRYIEFVDDLPRSAVKQEIERHTLRRLSNEGAWDARKAGHGS
jgi:crotonobetaine/carnitine-CoA ligase